jgi:hypothetical protein
MNMAHKDWMGRVLLSTLEVEKLNEKWKDLVMN